MKTPQKTEGPGSVDERSTLTSDLAARIRRAQAESQVAETPAGGGATQTMSGMGRGLRLGSEFAAAILVGAGMGYLLDQWLGTSPWLMLILLLLGFAAGVLNVIRSAKQMNEAATLPTGAPAAPEPKDE